MCPRGLYMFQVAKVAGRHVAAVLSRSSAGHVAQNSTNTCGQGKVSNKFIALPDNGKRIELRSQITSSRPIHESANFLQLLSLF